MIFNVNDCKTWPEFWDAWKKQCTDSLESRIKYTKADAAKVAVVLAQRKCGINDEFYKDKTEEQLLQDFAKHTGKADGYELAAEIVKLAFDKVMRETFVKLSAEVETVVTEKLTKK